MNDELGTVFAALADSTRRHMVQTLLRDGRTSVPALSAELPITRQAIAKHLATLQQAGLVERLPGAGREVSYGLRGEALAQASAWLREADALWERRLDRLKAAFQGGGEAPR
ncbi:MAG TPA: metalloregulator ArsR/SmtB family transcription factor [Solirubrobacteraceae bacterium]